MATKEELQQHIQALAEEVGSLQVQVAEVNNQTVTAAGGGIDPFVFALTVFVLACFVGYFVVWKVTPALHTPLMAVTNAISSIIIVGAILAMGSESSGWSAFLGFIAVTLASVNIFGGFIVTQRMLEMFKKK